ncbi:hypothetical protein KAM260_31940 [Klebsiella pneumoniae]|nr:hypothetical protein KAM260_31940 [Klebsiella pneumoniae]
MAPHDLVAPQPVESEVIIETRGLSRVYPGVTALDNVNYRVGNDSNLLIVFYVQIMPDDFVMQLHRF